ncbi:MAG: NAD-dependent epimerase/dehydratase family protein, partial [Chloroflexi bacterium]|nr:NAD-dependent epimerase/dehydratase family protein [Chloroflexota bacterium]
MLAGQLHTLGGASQFIAACHPLQRNAATRHGGSRNTCIPERIGRLPQAVPGCAEHERTIWTGPRRRARFMVMTEGHLSAIAKAPTGQTVIVTGAAGFIGSHTCEALLRRGDNVVAIDSFTPHYDPARKHANLASVQATADAIRHEAGPSAPKYAFLEADCCRADDLDRAFQIGATFSAGTPVRRMIHLAGRAGVRAPASEAPNYVAMNVVATTEVLEACRRHGFGDRADAGSPVDQGGTGQGVPIVGHLAMASSSSVYGGGPPGWKGPFHEDMPADRPLSVYAATKRATEVIAHAYTRVSNLRVTCLRFFTVVGPRARPDLTPSMFGSAIWAGRPITQFGDGSMARDYTFVGDTVTGILASLDRFDCAAVGAVEPGEAYEVINLGNDRPVSLAHYLDTLG